MQLTLGYDYPDTANADLRAEHGDPDTARTTHRVSLFDDHCLLVCDNPTRHQLARQRTGGTPRRRIFHNADGRVKKARVCRRILVDHIKGVGIAPLTLNLSKYGGDTNCVGLRAIDHAAVRHRNKEVGGTSLHNVRRVLEILDIE